MCIACGRIALPDSRFCQCGTALIHKCINLACQREFPVSHVRCDFCGVHQAEFGQQRKREGEQLRETSLILLNRIKEELEKGSYSVNPGIFADLGFDLVATRKAYLDAKQHLLIKLIAPLDEAVANEWKEEFDQIHKKKAGFFSASPFTLCLVAESTTSIAVESLIRHRKIMGLVACMIFIIDVKLGQLFHGDFPTLPIRANRILTSIERSLVDAINLSVRV